MLDGGAPLILLPGTYGPDPAPTPVFRKYVIQNALWKSTVQVFVPKGFETYCFDIDVRFFGRDVRFANVGKIVASLRSE